MKKWFSSLTTGHKVLLLLGCLLLIGLLVWAVVAYRKTKKAVPPSTSGANQTEVASSPPDATISASVEDTGLQLQQVQPTTSMQTVSQQAVALTA